MKRPRSIEPAVDFDFAAIDGAVEIHSDETRALATVARAYLSRVIGRRKGSAQFATWTRNLIADAYILGLFPGLTQRAIGAALGFAPGAARQGFQSLLRRRAAQLGLPALGPGRKRSRKRPPRAAAP